MTRNEHIKNYYIEKGNEEEAHSKSPDLFMAFQSQEKKIFCFYVSFSFLLCVSMLDFVFMVTHEIIRSQCLKFILRQ
jgi:hypothetical protein